MYNMHKKCFNNGGYTTEIDTSKMYNMHKKCIVEDTTVTLCEIDTCIICTA